MCLYNYQKERERRRRMIENTLACAFCLSIFESPVFLPCGHSICKKHVTAKLPFIKDDRSNPKKRKLNGAQQQTQQPAANTAKENKENADPKFMASQEAKCLSLSTPPCKIFCSRCDKDFAVPEAGFPPNILANELLEKNFQKFDFCEEQKEALKSCNDLSLLIGI